MKKELPEAQMAMVVEKLANLEFRLAKGANEKLQIGSFVGIFILLREALGAGQSLLTV
jgi:DNA polymerase III delta prime subunit